MRIKNLKKINTKALILTGIASAFAISIFLPTFSWFKSDTASPISVDGNIHGSYFESGDGTAANPFEIARPIQLYYLSWLQEMGYFNEAVYDENAGEYVLKQQYHFYLSKDLDMRITDENDEVTEEYIIPPIGTIKYPFVGSFDGKGHVITDLTITNHYSDYTKDPRHPTGSNTHSDSYEILGLFGVLGTTEATAVVNSSIIEQDGTIHQLQVNNQNVLVSYVAHDTTNYINGNYVQNVYLENVTIVASTDSQHALAGAVAGYSNATVANVGIKDATLSFASGLGAVSTIGTTNLSKYTAFGFVEPNFERKVDLINEQAYDPKATTKTYVSNSSGTAWGGSIDMAKLLQRTFHSQQMDGALGDNTIPEYPKKETYVYDGDTLLSHDISYDNRHYSFVGSRTGYYTSDKTANADSNYQSSETVGSYYYIDQSETRTNQNSRHKAYVGGFTNVYDNTALEVNEFNYSGSEEECYLVRSSEGTGNNFISISNTGTIITDSAQSGATKWHFKNGALIAHAKVKTTFNTGDNLNKEHETIYYLNCSNGTFSLGNSSSTSWSLSNGILSLPPKTGYKIYTDSTHYLSNNGTTLQNTNNANEATLWDIQNFSTSANGRISTTIGNNTYYLGVSGFNTSDSLRLNTSTSNTTAYRVGANQKNTYIYFTGTYNRRTYYSSINVSGNNWQITRSTTAPTQNNLTLEYAEVTESYNTVCPNNFRQSIRSTIMLIITHFF